MIVHTLRFSFKPDVSEADRAELLSALKRSCAVDSVAFSFLGQDLGDESEGYTHAFSAGWENLDALGRYLDGPGHREFVSLFVEHVGKFAVSNFSEDMDPTFGDRFQETHDRWIANDPALAERLGSMVVAS